MGWLVRSLYAYTAYLANFHSVHFVTKSLRKIIYRGKWGKIFGKGHQQLNKTLFSTSFEVRGRQTGENGFHAEMSVTAKRPHCLQT